MKKSEKILLSLFLGVLLIGGTTLLGQFLSVKGELLSKERHRLEMDQIKSRHLLSEKDRWLSQGRWVRASQPTFISDEDATKKLLEIADKAFDHGLEVGRTELLEIEDLAYATQVGMKLRVSGPIEGLSRYLHETQHPAAFRGVTNLSIKPNPEDASVVECEFTLVSLYRPRV